MKKSDDIDIANRVGKNSISFFVAELMKNKETATAKATTKENKDEDDEKGKEKLLQCHGVTQPSCMLHNGTPQKSSLTHTHIRMSLATHSLIIKIKRIKEMAADKIVNEEKSCQELYMRSVSLFQLVTISFSAC
ncbi:CLUMA_CG011432, isoform A [Clunio marinus]|uniref:CLUMA_CG011432, isoform A n=1 Tax=Clunio marinus TaxID=568069 RepID=A0A1J1ICQ4_9DIPT|nr:CLUMA_CG011432, isoform A [Clunio marinus]